MGELIIVAFLVFILGVFGLIAAGRGIFVLASKDPKKASRSGFLFWLLFILGFVAVLFGFLDSFG